MFCAKCGKEGFPVRIACLSCNATLPDIPAVLESPDARDRPKKVECAKCGFQATDARIACENCDQTFPRPFSLDRGVPTECLENPDIELFVIICCPNACEECKEFDGSELTKAQAKDFRMPITTCTRAVCWCSIVGVGRDEGTVILE